MHTGQGNVEFFNNDGQKNGWNIQVVTQPPQSPDLNVNDLFFQSLKCRVEKLKNGANGLNELYDSVVQAWNRYDADPRNRIWAHQFDCYRAIINNAGDNVYPEPHTGMRKRVQAVDLDLSIQDWNRARDFLDETLGI